MVNLIWINSLTMLTNQPISVKHSRSYAFKEKALRMRDACLVGHVSIRHRKRMEEAKAAVDKSCAKENVRKNENRFKSYTLFFNYILCDA